MLAALQPEAAKAVRDLVRARAQLGESELGLLTGRDIDDPEPTAILALRRARQIGIEPVERPVEGHRLRPFEPFDRGLIVGAGVEQELPGLLKGGHEFRSCILPAYATRAPLVRRATEVRLRLASVGRTGRHSQR